MAHKLNEKALDHIIDEMIDVVENSKDEIFNISEEARSEHDELDEELVIIKEKVLVYIEDGDQLEKQLRLSRKQLSKVSSDFDQFSEQDIREAYENTYDMQVKLAILRQEEKVLRDRRDDIERRLLTLNQTMERASGLASKISAVLTYLYDDFRQVNDMLVEAKAKQEFGLKIIEAQEEERKKISRDIHDGPAQMLANILLRTELVERACHQKKVSEALEEVKNVREMVRSSLQEVRRIIYDLRPMALDDLGLVPTLKKYIDNIADYHEMDIQFISIGKNKRIYQKYEIALFRLIQESLQNAIKHAEANLIKVKLEMNKDNLIMVVSDDGIGFDLSKKLEGSFGIIGMKERVDMLEGEFSINSIKNKGTKIYINIPYQSVANEINSTKLPIRLEKR